MKLSVKQIDFLLMGLDTIAEVCYNDSVKRQERKVRTMNDGLIFVCCFFGGLVLMCFALCKIMDFMYKSKDKKHHKDHPEFFRLREDFSEKANTACRFYNREIAPLKHQVKNMLEEEPYWPREVREEKLEELEEIRCKIYAGECMYRGLNKEIEEARKKVVNYVQIHNIKWAGVWE